MPPGERVMSAAACGACGCTASGPFYRVRHPLKGERVVCAAHARRVVALSDGGIKSSRGDVPSSTAAPLEAQPFEKGPGAQPTRPPCLQSMKASDSTPAKGESASGRTEPRSVADLSKFSVTVDVEVPPEVVQEAKERTRAHAESAGGLADPQRHFEDLVMEQMVLRFDFLDENGEALKFGAVDGGVADE